MIKSAGLTSAEARTRLEQHGPNALPEQRPEPLWHRFVRQFRSPLIYILLAALAVDVTLWVMEGATGLPLEAVAIGIILALNAWLGVWQERRAEDALARLRALAAPQVWVLRDGALAQCPSAELVPEDVVRLEAGDRVPADGVTLEGDGVQLDESVVTGESLPVDKAPGEELAAGTLVVRGTTYAKLTRTGADSAMGRVATLLGEVRPEPTPLERRLEAFGRRVARWILAVAALLALGGLWAEGIQQFGSVLLFAVALAVAAVPEGLPAVLTLTLALGVERMARRRAVVRRLAAVEGLGSVTVIATDKTGTITENRMEVRDVDAIDGDLALRTMVLASEAEPGAEVGDPLERALIAHAVGCGVSVETLRASHRPRSTQPFDAVTRVMRITVEQDGRAFTYLKGAPEAVLDRTDLPEATRRGWHEKVEAYAREGYRVLALACGDGEVERGLRWLGVVLLWDPPRPEVPDAIGRATAAGIRVLMITGDHPATALTVAREVGIVATRVVTGVELDGLTAEDYVQVAREVSVFARVTPEHKLRIVEALRRDGEIVAVTGDGVNDAPALKRADIGVAMGQRGSDVTREVADLVLLDDNFATIVAAVEEGRGIYENIQKFIRFLFSTNLSELLVVSIGAVAAFALGLRDAAGHLLLPLTAAQLLWINLVTDGAPALALGLDQNPGVMNRPPRDPSAPLLDRPSLVFILWSGAVKAAIALAVLATLPYLLGHEAEIARTATFLFMGAGQLLFAYPARRSELAPSPNRVVHIAVAFGLVAQVGVIVVPGLRRALGSVPIPGDVWLIVAAGMLAAWAFAEATSRAIRWSVSRAKD
jgi:Ca2+-transporting ATPase